MLVHIVSLGLGVGGVVGSRDIMAVSRAWAHSFAGLRKLHSLSSVSVSRTGSHIPTFEPLVQQSFRPARLSRSIAHAAALEESSDLNKKKGERLSRAERYVLVESFVLRHKASHEGKWPSLTAILKETGGSRVIVKDILDELTSKSGSAVAASLSTQEIDDSSVELETAPEVRGVPKYGTVGSLGRTEVEAVSTSDLSSDEEELESPVGYLPDDSSPNSDAKSNRSSGEVASDAGLWRKLRNLGSSQQDASLEAKEESPQPAARSPTPVTFDSYDTDLEEDGDIDELAGDDFEESDDAPGPVVVPHHHHSRPAPSSTPPAVESHGLFIRFLPLSATETDLRAAFQDCGEIVRAQAMQPKGSGLRFTYGFVDFSTPEGLSKALRKEKVFIKGSTVITEPCSGPRRSEGRPTSVRNPVVDPSRRIFTNSRPLNGARTPILTRLRRTDSPTGSDVAVRTPSVPERNSRFVAVEGLPYPMPISAIEKMMSAHGEIARSELGREEGGTYSAQVEFKTEEARDSALNSNRVYLGGRWCRITTGEPILTTVVRLSNIGADASENLILQRCQKFGRVEEIVVRREGVMDVYYHPSERKNMRRILDRMGEVNADYKRWHATLAPKCSPQEYRDSAEVQEWAEVQKDRLLDNLTAAIQNITLDLEDLRELVEVERHGVSSNGASRATEKPIPKWNRT
ncbi:hypothetical protein MPTK1_3g15270 [Marchantia polymorpha subsp. ruderalis]|uniref:RRM domain-containing protein n=2 Tax=Marchantia polymorpha TaxID=3197 RepID=A0AAF6B114_MARPO|nr:hypothetical protein MARPO_0004s0145 [Marchantia polymorpha]BBN05698.1 hypothetical protein Mp_3g15270 [Marchantia polymorpha subsp. ruderalis]|eukprot:PTQ48883.1 hypothetical protein MARPO_0004s0145 [Marchantia polymorpha]